jgi:RNA polymerase sigma factor (TIGR02999 family)
MGVRVDNPALGALVDVLYTDLHRLARRQRRRSGGGSETMRTTALVHEAYLKLARQGAFRDRGHFLATAALAIRQVLVDHARAQLTDKRDHGGPKLPLEAAEGVLAEDGERIVGLDEALKRLEALNPRYARVVECRYFAGYSDAETALALGITERTVQRDWVKAKALLYEALEPRGA